MDASASSPHLRKSGSWAVVSDFGAFEPGSGFEEEALLHGLEANEMKGVSIPSSTTAPSPVLLWRLKISWDSVMRMSLNLRDLFLYEAFLYYNPLLLVTLVVWFWGMNLWVFSQANVDFARIFDVDRNHLTHREIWKVILYAAFAMALIFPFDIFYLSSRYFLLRTLWRIVFPLQASLHYLNVYNKKRAGHAIAFPDFFLADILTSMSKVFSDLERSVCRMVHRQEIHESRDFLQCSGWRKATRPSMARQSPFESAATIGDDPVHTYSVGVGEGGDHSGSDLRALTPASLEGRFEPPTLAHHGKQAYRCRDN
ncbi:hypothetical protein T459_02242 [Capsicum annuum]|uniref:EXS domain-containing protein n=1 Tax=Capsicum annuum TaxID=4072 RepID=A0A2G3AJI1_CAPAN|nr:hypothetical protein T459_02242 [Capsicum annuum]